MVFYEHTRALVCVLDQIHSTSTCEYMYYGKNGHADDSIQLPHVLMTTVVTFHILGIFTPCACATGKAIGSVHLSSVCRYKNHRIRRFKHHGGQ